MYSRASLLRRTCQSFLRSPTATPQKSFFSLSARSHNAVDSAMADAAAAGGLTPDALKGKLVDQLQAQHVEIEDLSGGCGQAFQAVIVSPQFESKNMLARHRLVNSVLKAEIAAIHAWTPKCYTPQQWEELQQRSA